jgi:hypothetical protein
LIISFEALERQRKLPFLFSAGAARVTADNFSAQARICIERTGKRYLLNRHDAGTLFGGLHPPYTNLVK